MDELWRPVVGYEGWYEVSNKGSVKRVMPGAGTRCRILKPYIDTKGYHAYTLTINGRQKDHRAHRLVAYAWIENREGKPCINHKDSNRKNNVVSNLEWVTYRENTNHCIKNGRFNQHLHGLIGEKNSKAKLKESDILEIRNSKESLKNIAEKFGVTWKYVSNIRCRRAWKHI